MSVSRSFLASCTCFAFAASSGGSSVANEIHSELIHRRPFVEFHARSGPYVFGHSFIVYGTFDNGRRSTDARVAGLYAIADTTFGGLLPVPARVGRTKDDLTGIPEVVYQRELSQLQLLELQNAVLRVRASQPSWHLIFFNCNDFLREMAEAIGLRRPVHSIMLPVTYVSLLRALNSGR